MARKGKIKDACFYDVALSDEEIATLSEGTMLPTRGLVAYFPLIESSEVDHGQR